MKRYIIRKYIMANSAKEALKKERALEADDVWVDDEWKRLEDERLKTNIGFK